MTEAVFDKVGDEFVSYYATVRGYVREQLTRNNLSVHLGKNSCRVLDVGGGDGRDAIWLANLGHQVTVVDPSSVMLVKAANTVKKQGLEQLVTLKHGKPEEVIDLNDGLYDLVLSHGVMMYLNDPQAHINFLGRAIKRGGIVSVLTKGKAGSLLRLLHRQEIDAAIELSATDHLVNNLGQNVLAVSEKMLQSMLTEARLCIIQTFGVRIATEFDYRAVIDISEEELASIIGIETSLGADEHTKGMGQMLQFICKQEGT